MRKRPIEIKFRLSQQEFAVLQEQLKSTGLSRNMYLVRLISNVPILPQNQLEQLNEELVKQNRQLRGIANNINQLAKIANANKDIYERTQLDFAILQIGALQEELHDIWNKVRGVLHGNT